jgi:pseudouridine-5'-phosphate glycosidase
MTRKAFPDWLVIQPEVRAALMDGKPVVALESTVITHGLPQPINLETAMHMEEEVRQVGAVPATVAVVSGRIHLGVDTDALERLALSGETRKVSLRDLGTTIARFEDGGTTVAATMFVSHAAGVRVFATGGIGGVHRGDAGDVSTDLPTLARIPVAVICSGAKAFLDLPRTLEWLETAGVPVIGFQTSAFPAFVSRQSDLPISASADSPQEVAGILKAHWELGLQSGVLVGVPCPPDAAVPWEQLIQALAEAEDEAAANDIQGAALTPFLLDRLGAKTRGATLQANLALLRNNARVGAEISVALQTHT